MTSLEVLVPRALSPLLSPARYKGAWGGRGGAKSHFFAEQVVIRCYRKATRVVCIREVQNSIRDSVRQLLIDKIRKLGLEWAFDVLEAEIRGRVGTPAEGSLIVFRGMQSYNAANIKSLEGFHVAWIEEAQTLSQYSLDLLRPTIRSDGSELWFSWNPRFKTDPVDQFLRRNPPPNSVVVQVNWSDNPWFPVELKTEMEHDFETDPDKAEHVWNGAYGATQGAVLNKWVNKARKAGRVTNSAVYDPQGAPIRIVSDIGYRDTTVWWFWQPKLGGITVFKCIFGNGMDAEDWADEIAKVLTTMGVSMDMLGKIWLPHDARVKTFQSKYSSLERFIAKYGMAKMGIVPMSKKHDQIEAARYMIDQCEFHETDCSDGLDGLDAWHFEFNEETQIFSKEPEHDWSSHFGDSFAYACQVMQGLKVDPKPEEPRNLVIQAEGTSKSTLTMDDAWTTQTTGTSGRI